MREFWIRDNKKHFNVSEKMTDHHYACFDHPNIEYPDYHVIEKKEADKLAAALLLISSGNHLDTCSHSLISPLECDCHISVSRQALKDYKGEK